MAFESFANNASTTLNGIVLIGDSTLTVAANAQFPATGQFRILIDSEILLVASNPGLTWTVTRAQEGTLASQHASGATVTHILTAQGLKNLLLADLPAQHSTLTVDGNVLFGGPNPWIDITAYGAATGAADTVNLAAIVAANAYAVTKGGGRLWVPPGTYNVSDKFSLSSNVSLFGAGGQLSILNCTATSLTGSPPAFITLLGSCLMQGLGITANFGTNAGRVISINGNDCTVDQCTVTSSGTSTTDGGCVTHRSGSRWRVTNCVLTASALGGVIDNCLVGANSGYIWGNIIVGSASHTSQSLISIAPGTVASTDYWIGNNDLRTSGGVGINHAGSANSASYLYILNNKITDVTNFNIQCVQGGADHYEIIGNFCDQSAVTPTKWPISVGGGGGFFAFDVNCSHNSVRTTKDVTYGIEFAGAAGVIANGNRVQGTDGVGPDHGIVVNGCPNASISGGRIDTVGVDGILITTTAGSPTNDGVIEGVVISNFGLTATNFGTVPSGGITFFHNGDTTQNWRVASCVFRDQTNPPGTGQRAAINSNDTGHVIGPNVYDNVVARIVCSQSPGFVYDQGIRALTDAATVATDVATGYDYFTAALTANRTIGAPTNVFTGAEITYDILNSKGSAMTTTWNAAFKLAGAWVDPASTKRRTIIFVYDGSNWIEQTRAAADI